MEPNVNTDKEMFLPLVLKKGNFHSINWTKVITVTLCLFIFGSLAFFVGHKLPVRTNKTTSSTVTTSTTVKPTPNNLPTPTSIYQGWSTTTIGDHVFSLQYPPDWKITTNSGENASGIGNVYNAITLTKDNYKITLNYNFIYGTVNISTLIAKSEDITVDNTGLGVYYINSSDTTCGHNLADSSVAFNPDQACKTYIDTIGVALKSEVVNKDELSPQYGFKIKTSNTFSLVMTFPTALKSDDSLVTQYAQIFKDIAQSIKFGK